VDWKRAAALLYGDWGTSKAYVIGAAFAYPILTSAGKTEPLGYRSFPIILAVCFLTAIVGYNYSIICKYFPDGGGVYSAARSQSRLLAVVGALMLVADLTVTAALSGWSAMTYFKVPAPYLLPATIGMILLVGAVNCFGPKHSGSMALFLAIPTVVVVMLIIAFSLPIGPAGPHLTPQHLESPNAGFLENWKAFVGVILALSGVESIANMTGVMKLDSGTTMENPEVGKTAQRAIWVVAVEVVLGTALLGWAMLSLDQSMFPKIYERREDMLSLLAEQYGAKMLGPLFGRYFDIGVGIIVGLLLLSAVNTAIAALIGLVYLLARDGEMPREFTRLNSHGVPWVPLIIAGALPLLVVVFSPSQPSLMELYAIGVVGAITVNLGSCVLNKGLKLRWFERGLLAVTFLVLLAVEITLAKTKPNALFFIVCILTVGLVLRAYAQRRAGLRTLTVSQEVAAAVAPESMADFRLNLAPGQAILVAARGPTPVLKFALEEARLRQARLYVLYVKELAVALPGSPQTSARPRWQDDPHAAEIMYGMLEQGQKNDVAVIPLYAVSDNPAGTILDLSATLGADMLMLGSPQRNRLVHLLKGNVVTEVARNLPENIQLVIYG
jgi:amino acid transporter/nucleotide-binding universal stress UspA family protein